MNFNHDAGLIDTILTIDTSQAPPLGGLANSLNVVGTGALILPRGTTLQRPAGQSAMIRFNNDAAIVEYYNGTSWENISAGAGTVSSITVTTSNGMTVSSGSTQTITASGTFALELDSDLQGLAGLSTTGMISRTGAGSYQTRTITGTAGNITVSNGDGVSGNPTINLPNVGSPVTGSFVKITTDAQGRVTSTTAVTSSDITPLVSGTYISTSGGSMQSGANITFSGGGEVLGLPATPTSPGSATSKAYVDSLVQGLDPKQSVRVATVVGGAILSAFQAGQVIDGVTLVAGDRILIKNQSAAQNNGVYIVRTIGEPDRAPDMDTWAEVPGAFLFVEEGDTQADTAWVCTSNQGGTINVDPITFVQFSSAGSYSAGTGLTLSGTTFSLSVPVTTANGGTGITSTPSNGQLLIGNGSGYTLSTLTAGAGVSITNGPGTITIASSGVTSVGITAPSFLTVTGSPITSSGTIALTLASQTAGTVFAGPVSGGSSAPTFRQLQFTDLSFAIKLYAETPAIGAAAVSSGTNSFAIGNNATSTGIGTGAFGTDAKASQYGQKAFSSGSFAAIGDAQSSKYILRGTTVSSTLTELFLDGSSTQIVVPINAAMTFSILVVARRSDTTGGGAGYRIEGVIKKDSSSGSVTMIGAPAKVILGETNTPWDVTVDADTTTGALRVRVTGEPAKTIRWVAVVDTAEVVA